MTFSEFQSAMSRLEGLKFGPANLHTHWEGLKDCELGALTRAVGHAVKNCESYPSPAELRRFAIETLPEMVGPDDTGEFFCEVCGNTGWCDAGDRMVRKCVCWSTNPVLIRRRERGAQQAAHRTAKQDRA